MSFSDVQKKEICRLSRIVWNTRVSNADKVKFGTLFNGKTEAFNAWRHHEQCLAVGKESLLECSDSDFCALMAHFYLLLGNRYKAGFWIMRASTEAARKVLFLIFSNCRRGGLEYPSYVDKICLSQFKCRLWQAKEGQLFCLLSTVRNRISAKLKKEKENA